MSTHESSASTGRGMPTVVLGLLRLVRARESELLLVSSVLVAGALLALRIDSGWWPHDDGSLAHSAQRVLGGELPHRDFVELYTGGLTFINAALFGVVGEDMLNLRIPLFVLFLAYVAAFFAIARRFVSPTWSFVATMVAISWSAPVYPAPMPSWYVLFLSTIGIYAIVRFFETGHRRWLAAAGLCGGVAVAIKITGIWYVAGAVLALLLRPTIGGTRTTPRRRSALYSTAVSLMALVALGMAVAVVGGRFNAAWGIGLLLPVAVLCFAAAAAGLRGLIEAGRSSGGRVAADVVAFSAAAAVPLMLTALPYAVTGSVGDLLEGVFVTPKSRFEFASLDMPPATSLLRAVPVAAIFLIRGLVPVRARRLLDLAAGVMIVLVLATSWSQTGFWVLWGTARALAPFVVILGAFAIVRRTGADERLRAPTVAVVVLVAGFSTLTQFPYAPELYFCYVAPLILVAGIACTRWVSPVGGMLPRLLLVSLAVFGLSQLDRQPVSNVGWHWGDRGRVATATLDHERASIQVSTREKRVYNSVQALVELHNDENRPIFAGPDSPEIYFLTGSRNVTPSVLDFLDRSGSTRGSKLFGALSANDVRVVVLNHDPGQSPKLTRATVQRLRSMYAGGERVGRYEVRWLPA